jgi:hypothetical protein
MDSCALLAMNQQGLSDAEIARRFSCPRSTVTYRRRKLGLPSNKGNDFHCRKISEGVQRRYERHGIRSVDFRLAKMRRAAANDGWPESISGRPLRITERKILGALWDYGPQTIKQLQKQLGRKPIGRKSHPFQVGSRSCLTDLEQAGLITCLGQIGKDGKKGYATRVYAIAIHVERNQKIV